MEDSRDQLLPNKKATFVILWKSSSEMAHDMERRWINAVVVERSSGDRGVILAQHRSCIETLSGNRKS